jgi:predicted amidophosphoribosyltransferase
MNSFKRFSTKANCIAPPLSLIGWNFKDSRTAQVCVGNSLLDGDYRTSWEYFNVPQRIALSSSLAFVKGGIDKIPRGLSFPGSADGMILKHLVADMTNESRLQSKNLVADEDVSTTIFSEVYDVIVPLPSSTGKASLPNIEVANAVSVGLGGQAGPPIDFLVNRVKPMTVKSTKTVRQKRREKDAAKQMHFGNMSLERSCFESIKGKSILLYDDVITWGNTSEAARNLLLLAGAKKVDVLTVFSTGPMIRAAKYTVLPDLNLVDVLCSQEPNLEHFQLEKSYLVEKNTIQWNGQETMKIWHENLGKWVERYWPSYVPNDIPFL